MTSERDPVGSINPDEVSRLLDTLERDISNMRVGATSVETLRREVEQLRAALDAREADRTAVHEQTHTVRQLLEGLAEELRSDVLKGSQYIERIGRMLGM